MEKYYSLSVFSETVMRSKSKEKRKGSGWWKYHLKKIEKGVYLNLLHEIGDNDRESHFM